MDRSACFGAFAFAVLLAAPGLSRAMILEEGFSDAASALHAVNPAAFSAGNAEDQLLQLLDDPDQNVRAQAAKALRPYVLADLQVQDRLTAIMEAAGDNVFVRKEAIKSLAIAASRSSDLRRRMIAVVQRPDDSDIVRSIACKALYSTLDPANPAADVRDALLKILGETNERPLVRAGAAWGLFPDAGNEQTQGALLSAANDQWLEAGARAEAIRSLYFTLDQRQPIRDSIRALADETLTPLPTRFAAVVVFHRVNKGAAVADWLQGLSRDASPIQIRTAAILAQTEGLTEDLARYFHFTAFDGRALDPLVDE